MEKPSRTWQDTSSIAWDNELDYSGYPIPPETWNQAHDLPINSDLEGALTLDLTDGFDRKEWFIERCNETREYLIYDASSDALAALESASMDPELDALLKKRRQAEREILDHLQKKLEGVQRRPR